MTPNTFSVRFIIRSDRMDKQGYVPIYARITLNGIKQALSTNHSIRPHDWLKEKEQAKPNTTNFKVINEGIEAYKSKIYQAYSKVIASGESLTMDNLKAAFYGKNKKQVKGLIETTVKHNEYFQKLVGIKFSQGSYKNYKTSLAYFKEFVPRYYKKKDIPLDELSIAFCDEFFTWLTTIKTCRVNGANKHIQRLKKIVNYAIYHGFIKDSPVCKYSVSFDPVTRVALTIEEIQAIAKLDLQRSVLIEVRDMFLLQCYTGLSYADLKLLTIDDIKTIHGDQWIKMERQKTKIEFSVPLLAPAIKILNKYFKDSKVLPVLTNQKMNENLKFIQELAGISKNLHCHLARHSFATTITLSNGVAIDTVSKMLGHTKLSTTQIYAKTLDSKIAQDMKGVKKKYNGKMK